MCYSPLKIDVVCYYHFNNLNQILFKCKCAEENPGFKQQPVLITVQFGHQIQSFPR